MRNITISGYLGRDSLNGREVALKKDASPSFACAIFRPLPIRFMSSPNSDGLRVTLDVKGMSSIYRHEDFFQA